MRRIKFLFYEVFDCLISLWRLEYAFTIIGVFFAIKTICYSSASELLINCFSGPIDIKANPMIILAWILHQTVIFYIVGTYFCNELNDRFVYTIMRTRSKTNWIIYRIIHIVILILVYYLILFFALLLLKNFIYNQNTTQNYITEILKYTEYEDISLTILSYHIFILLILTTVALSMIQILLILISRSFNLSFVILEICLITSIGIRNINIKLDKYFIANQGIFIKHAKTNFSLSFSYFYIFCAIFICVFVIKKYSVTNEL